MKTIAGYLMIVCVVGGGCLGWPLSAQGEAHPPEHPVAGQEWQDPVSGIDVVWVPEGCFQMGCVSGVQCREAEKPVHEVCLDGFWMGKYEVTQAQWQQVMGENPSHFKKPLVNQDTSNHPIEGMSWHDVQEFLQRLNEQAGKAMYRLPSEAEWEYAARAGTQTAYSFGNDAGRLGEYAWYAENSGDMTHPVGELKPNTWGLYDMHGNVGEWCQDWYAATYYSDSPKENPPGPASGSGHVSRGGLWFSLVRGCRSAFRAWDLPDLRGNEIGFRLVRTPS